MRHLPYFSVAHSGGEGHLDARGGGGKSSHAVRMQSGTCPDAIQHYRQRKKRDERSRRRRRRERRFVRCDDSRKEDDECGEQKLSDVREAGSKKAPQIHAINNVSPHT